ncbi:MAG: ribonuclease T [Hyphomicrobium sp.]|uniref:ribonuclease T2 family protein n=1 Tax=Hyphomicrobium sp. TaxID=82 RepID=UPI003D0C0AE6
MRAPPKLTVPGLLALLLVAGVLMYLERREGGGSVPPAVETAGARTAGAAADFDYYALVLSWSPTHCESPEGQDDDAQCAPRNRRPYAFILHGLWPQYERGYPEVCRVADSWVPQDVIDRMMDVMPGKGLIIHEYRKHGSCSGLAPRAYYEMARRIYDSVRIPERFRNPGEAQFLDPGDVVQAFVAANPQLKPGMIAVSCGGPGSRLREVRICVGKSGGARPCGANEEQAKLCRSTRMHVPPVR